ncbi:hypothetical protein LCGC14_0370330 [marine sediment metagenome]|uniref:Uncharacterized protein n=1 Tax=marine sediment metagenome TaxID=412755 RepID=A0A0F9TBG4_9ZZZZ
MAVTILDHAMVSANEGKMVLAAIENWFARESHMAQSLVWATNKELAVQITSWKTLPTVGTRILNAGFSESSGKFQQKIESKYIFGHYIDVDSVLVDANPAERTIQRQQSAEGMAFKFNDMFINGDPQSNEFKGLSGRVDDVNALGGIYTDQYIDAGSATTGKGILYDTTERHYFIDQMAKLKHVIVGHRPDAFLMNSKMYLAFESAMRRESLLKQDADQFGRIINMFSSVPLVDIGIKADQATEIITNGESLSLGSDETSIYAYRLGEGKYLWGIQQKPMEVIDHGRRDSAPVFRDEVQWVIGLAVSDPRSIARAYGFVADSGAS